MSSTPVLYSPSQSDKLVLETDASNIGLGGCLKAVTGKGTFIVGYCSKKFVDNEVGWNIVEKEAFSILFSVRHFHHYLAGAKFNIRCDNRIVTYIRDKSKPRNKKLLGWALELSDYDYDVHHISSTNNNIVDCLSRLMCVSSVNNENELSDSDLVREQGLDNECCAAKLYIESGKRNFDVAKL